MNKLIIASAIALAAGLGQAEPFAFEKQFGNPDLDPMLGAPDIAFAPVEPSRFTPSVYVWYSGNPDVDVRAGIDYEGHIVPSGPTRISLYEFYRGNPDGTAYRDYHQRYPMDTDWEAIAQEHRRQQQNRGLAHEPPAGEVGS